MAEVAEQPPEARGDRAARVVVGDDDAVSRDAEPRERRGEGVRARERVTPGPARRRRREIAVEVDEDRAREVPCGVLVAPGAGLSEVPAHVDDADPRIGCVRGEPVDVDEGSAGRGPPSTERSCVTLLLRRRLEVLGEVAQDHLVERLLADELLAEDRGALLRARGREDRRRARRRVAPGGRRPRRLRRRIGRCRGRERARTGAACARRRAPSGRRGAASA